MVKQKKRILVLGATGMLGSTLFRVLSADQSFDTFGTIRNSSALRYFKPETHECLITNIHLEGEGGLLTAFSIAKPDIVINCIGIIKQLPKSNDYLESLAINASLPHRLAKYCSVIGARLIHFSTDCVFSGRQGQYKEIDFPDANDLYGRSKLLGEVNYENTLTLRTSIIGHELNSNKSLVDWFLDQAGTIKGYKKAIFSGLPTIEVARILRELVIPNSELNGLYHLSVDPINKYDLLICIADTYKKDIKVIPDDNVVIDRSLNSDKFRVKTGFTLKPWPVMINEMYSYHCDFFS